MVALTHQRPFPPSGEDVSVHFADGHGLMLSVVRFHDPQLAVRFPLGTFDSLGTDNRQPANLGFDFIFGCDHRTTLLVHSDIDIPSVWDLIMLSKPVTQTLAYSRLVRDLLTMVPRYFRGTDRRIFGFTHTIFRNFFPWFSSSRCRLMPSSACKT